MRDGDAAFINEITPAMLAAGLEILEDWGIGDDLDEARPLLVIDLWRAMRRAMPAPAAPRPEFARGDARMRR